MSNPIEQRPCKRCGILMWDPNISQTHCSKCRAQNQLEQDYKTLRPKEQTQTNKPQAHHTLGTWKAERKSNGYVHVYTSQNGRYHPIAGEFITLRHADAKHIAHCVNSHDELLEALKDLTDLTDKAANAFPIRVSQNLTDKIAEAKILIAKTSEK